MPLFLLDISGFFAKVSCFFRVLLAREPLKGLRAFKNAVGGLRPYLSEPPVCNCYSTCHLFAAVGSAGQLAAGYARPMSDLFGLPPYKSPV